MKLSIILPAYNCEKTLDECLKSIFEQKFPKKDFEVLFLENFSIDRTHEIAKKYPVKIIRKNFVNEEEARILGILKAQGEVICFIDSDNVLIGKDWLKKVLEPFKDKEIFFADTLFYSYRDTDKIKVKYQALIGGDDPLAMYLGLYSRWSYLTKDWTGYPHKDKDQGNYFKSSLLDQERVPAMGSNGFLVRTKLVREYVKPANGKLRTSFIHPDFVYYLIKKGYNCFAKVKTGIVHNQPLFFLNKIRRIIRRKTKEVIFEYDYGLTKADKIKTAVYVALIFPILYDTLRGYSNKPSNGWLFHPVACFEELFLHGYYAIKYKLGF